MEFVDDWQKKTKFFEVLDVWQKIQEGCWVLGVLLKNISQRFVRCFEQVFCPVGVFACVLLK